MNCLRLRKGLFLYAYIQCVLLRFRNVLTKTQASSPDSSRLQGCNLSLWCVGDLPTVKPEATTTSCRKTQDKQQQEEKSGIKNGRAERDKYTHFFPEGGQIEAADVASWETLRRHKSSTISWCEKWRLSFVWRVSCPRDGLKSWQKDSR